MRKNRNSRKIKTMKHRNNKWIKKSFRGIVAMYQEYYLLVVKPTEYHMHNLLGWHNQEVNKILCDEKEFLCVQG